MKLYYTPSACSLAPHIILRETEADFSLEKVDLGTKTTEHGQSFLDINPKGYVPVLELENGEWLTEGVVIQQYLADLSPAAKLAPPRGSTERLRLDELLVFISTEIHKPHGPLFSPTMPAEAKAAFQDKIGQRYDLLERTLADGRRYLTGDAFTIADAYLFAILGWAARVELDLSRWPRISGLKGRVGARPAVREALAAEGLAPKS